MSGCIYFKDRNGKRVLAGDEIFYFHEDLTATRIRVRHIVDVHDNSVRFYNQTDDPIWLEISDVERIPRYKTDEYVMLVMFEGYQIRDGNNV